MNWIWLMILLLNVLIGSSSYLTLRRRRQLFSDRFVMIVAMSSSMVLSLVVGMLCSFILPFSFSSISMLTAIAGGITGIFFGAMVKLHSVLAGFFWGTIGGLMGAMVGAVVMDPSLCGLPSVSSMNLFTNMITFSVFGTTLTFISFSLINYSLKV